MFTINRRPENPAITTVRSEDETREYQILNLRNPEVQSLLATSAIHGAYIDPIVSQEPIAAGYLGVDANVSTPPLSELEDVESRP